MREFNAIVIAQSIVGARDKEITRGAKLLAVRIGPANRINDANNDALRRRVADP
jgi:hypothetical protein